MIDKASIFSTSIRHSNGDQSGERMQTPVNRNQLSPFPFGIFLAVITLVLTVAFAFKLHADLKNFQRSISFAPCLIVGLVFWLSWVFVFLVSSKFSCRWAVKDQPNTRSAVLVHILVGSVVSVLSYLLLLGLFYAFYKLGWFPRHDISRFTIVLNLAIYVAIVGIQNAQFLWEKSVRLRDRQNKLKVDLAYSQLQALKMQLQPHFLFNALNTIRMLIETEPAKAAKMTTLLGEFLRITLESDQEDEVSLSRELSFIQSFLDIQKIRFEDRIVTELIVDKEAADVLVPSLILQPVVENAFTHGCGKSLTPGKLEIHAACQKGKLIINVHDTGSGGHSVYSERTGLNNTRSRLKEHYGDQAEFTIRESGNGGTIVTISIPARLNTVIC